MNFIYNTYLRSIMLMFIVCLIATAEVRATDAIAAGKMQLPVQDTIIGTIVDAYGKPICDSKIIVAGKSNITFSPTGNFTLSVTKNDMVIFSHAGYYSSYYRVKGIAKKVNISLKEAFLTTADSIDVLFGRKPLANTLSAVSSINTNQLLTSPTQSLLPALSGRFAGLSISQTSGYPGTDGDGQALTGNISAAIRGFSGKTASGNELLVLIDGAIRPYNSIAPEEIESITLLKDAISTVMLGQRSTPGMLLITTKKGASGTPRMSFSLQTAIQTPLSSPQKLSAYDYANLYNQTQLYSGIAPTAVKYNNAALTAFQTGSDPYLFPNVDWQNVILKNRTVQNKFNYNIQGSGENIRYFVSLDYLKDNGLFNTASFNSYNTSPDYSRISLRSNIGVDFTKSLKLDVGIYGRIQDQTQPGNSDAQNIYNLAITTPATAYPINNPDGTLGGNTSYNTNLYGRSVQNGYSLVNTKDLSFDLSLTQKLDKWLNGLYIKANGNVNISNAYLTDRHKSFAFVPITAAASGTGYTYGTAIGTNTDIPNPVTAQGSNPQFRQTSTYFQGLLGYDHQFGANAVSVKIVANQQATTRNQDLPYIYNTVGSNITYNYKQKYFAEVAGSYGSFNQFSTSHQYQPFYAVGLGWNIAQESIIKNNVSWLSNLKFRVNYGKTGYVNRGNYGYFAYLQRYSNTGSYYYFGSNATSSQGYAEAGLANAEAEGEKAKKLNSGIDVGLFKDHLSFSADYFINNIYNIWITPGSTFQVLGSNTTQANIGKQKYSGAEFTATYKNNLKSFHYFLSLNLSVIQTKLVYNAEAPAENSYQLSTGLPIGIFSGLTAVGLFRSQTEINSSSIPSDVPINTLLPGDIKYLDRNNDGIIDSKDAGPIGSTKPQLYYGATLGFSYKGFDVSALIQGVQNRQAYLSGDNEWAFRNNGLNTAFQNNLNAYSTSNPNSNYSRLTIGTNVNNEKTSNFWLHDAGFIRLKNAEVGYTISSKWTNKLRIPSARVYVNGENLLTSTQLNDFGTKVDPEVNGSSFPLQRIINFGINIKL